MIGGSLEHRADVRRHTVVTLRVSPIGRGMRRRWTMKARVFVVDDHPIVRGGLAQLINQEADLAGLRRSGGRARPRSTGIDALKPDVAVVDISLHGPDGLELVKNLRTRHIAVPVRDSVDARRIALRGAGAARRGRAYLMKQEADRAGAGRAPPRPRRRHLRQRPDGEPAARPDRPAPARRRRLAAALPERSRARGVPADRPRQRHPPDRRRRCT